MRKFSVQQTQDSDQGLPNIGNTCFLNTAIQALFSIKSFRTFVLNDNRGQNSMTNLLKNIFAGLQKFKTAFEKKVVLNNLHQLLVRQMPDYSGYSQEDSSMFLLHILNRLTEQNSYYENFFHHDLLIKCGKGIDSDIQIQNQVILPRLELYCSNSTLSPHRTCIYLTKKPQALIVLHQSKVQEQIQINFIGKGKYQASAHYSNNQNQKLQFELKAIILYTGNQFSGHYVCLRKSQTHQSKYVLINDLNVSEPKKLQEWKLSAYQPLMFFYSIKKAHYNLSKRRSLSIYSKSSKSNSLKDFLLEKNSNSEKGDINQRALPKRNFEMKQIDTKHHLQYENQLGNRNIKASQRKKQSFTGIICSNICNFILSLCS